ncbi:MAG: hypothetical protein J7M26_07715, partial [Armatimonadetes bacterium]|nr:hypothetical protein [Armatimonadota bacterium]
MDDKASTAPKLRAGLAQTDITPPIGTHLAGAVGQYRPAEAVLDPLQARALVLESDGRRMGVLALDVTIITAQYTAAIRERARRLGLEPEALMVHATQTHSAPAVGYFMVDEDFPALPPELEWVRGAEAAYADLVVERAEQALREAVESLQPVEWGAASGIEGRLAFNRRAVRRDGTVGMPGRRWEEPLGPTWIAYIEGPIDPELGVIALRAPEAEMVGLVLNYACHPVHVFPRPLVSADWPAAAAEGICAALGDEACQALV